MDIVLDAIGGDVFQRSYQTLKKIRFFTHPLRNAR